MPAALASPEKQQEGHRWRLRQKHGEVHPWTQKKLRRFETLAKEWWDERGKFRALHAINPARLAFIVEEVQRWRRAKGRPSGRSMGSELSISAAAEGFCRSL